MSYEQLMARRRELERFIEGRRASRAELERVLAKADLIQYRVALKSKIEEIEREISAAETELKEVNAKIAEIRSALRERKGELRSRVEMAVSSFEKKREQALAKLDEAIKLLESLLAEFPNVLSAIGEARRAGEILGESLVPPSRVHEFTGLYISRALDELRAARDRLK